MNFLRFGLATLAMVAAGCGSGPVDGGRTPAAGSTTVGPGPSAPAEQVEAEPVEAEPVEAEQVEAEQVEAEQVEAAPVELVQVTPATSTTASPAATATLATIPTTTAVPSSSAAPAATVAEGPDPEPERGHPPRPEAGMIPRGLSYWDYPDCAPGPPWPPDCYPPSEWEVAQDLSDCAHSAHPGEGAGGICAGRRAGETPRWTRDVARWTSWCFDQPRGNCTWLLHEMKWALDYLGAHPWCVLDQYQDRADAYGAGARGTGVKNRHGWHNCATVIDPLVGGTPPARTGDAGLLLSDGRQDQGGGRRPAGRTGDAGLLLSEVTTLAEQCRTVLPAGVELEARVRRRAEQPERFGSDCDAWAEWVESRPSAEDWRDCDRSARLAEEWMEHHHDTPERYFPVAC